MNKTYLSHHGILGMKWGVRRYQNEDGTLTPAGVRRYQRLDDKWIKRKSKKIYDKVHREAKPDMENILSDMRDGYLAQMQKGGKPPGERTRINDFNRRLANVLNKKSSDIQSPSGRVVKWVAKRGQTGVYMALAAPNYDIKKLKQGVWADGRIAYRKKKVEVEGSKGGG